MKTSEFIERYAMAALEEGIKEWESLEVDGESNEPVQARGKYEVGNEIVWITVRRLPSDVTA